MKVKAAPGIKAPILGKPKEYITSDRISDVPDEHYYRVMVADGDLIEVDEKEWADQVAADEKALADAIAADEKARADAVKAAKAAAKSASAN